MKRKASSTQIDLTRFHETFYQESFEGLSSMESGLLALGAATGTAQSAGGNTAETIDTVFRAAHSIKGSSATFGFEDIANFTHLLETLLDLMREGRIKPDSKYVDVLLQSIDGLRELLTARSESREANRDLIQGISSDLTSVLAQVEEAFTQVAVPSVVPAGSAASFEIEFTPHQHFFKSGNDPLMFLRNLAELGSAICTPVIDRLPGLQSLETSDCFLSWKIVLSGTKSTAAEIRAVFEWVDTDCDLSITGSDVSLDSLPVEQPNAQNQAATVTALLENNSAEPAQPRAPVRESATIRVGTDKVDAVINLVGELVITQSMLSCISDSFDLGQLSKLRSGIALLARNARELQETVLKMRMLPIGFLFDRYPRLVHDLSKRLKKSVRLQITGESTEIDKAVLERLGDPLVHLIRNSLDHGIEMPDVRLERGKQEEGTLHLHAEHRGGNILIEISDDGGGLNTARILSKAKERGLIKQDAALSEADIHALIFAPGFSTADELTDLSGRGVGMDVVRRNIEELSGRIGLASSSTGTIITIELPLTLAILDGQLLRVREQRYVVPLTSIVESLRINPATLHTVPGGGQVYLLRHEYLPIIHLGRLLGCTTGSKVSDQSLLMVVESRGRRVALLVDELLAQQQVVIKSLEANFMRVRGVAGATILGDGSVAMILDVAEVIQLSRDEVFSSPAEILAPESAAPGLLTASTIQREVVQ